MLPIKAITLSGTMHTTFDKVLLEWAGSFVGNCIRWYGDSISYFGEKLEKFINE